MGSGHQAMNNQKNSHINVKKSIYYFWIEATQVAPLQFCCF